MYLPGMRFPLILFFLGLTDKLCRQHKMSNANSLNIFVTHSFESFHLDFPCFFG